MAKLTGRITNIEFDFPPQYVEKLRELLRDFLNISFEEEDFYSFEHAKIAGFKIGISKREVRDKD